MLTLEQVKQRLLTRQAQWSKSVPAGLHIVEGPVRLYSPDEQEIGCFYSTWGNVGAGLEDFGAGVGKFEVVNSSCSSDTPLTPTSINDIANYYQLNCITLNPITHILERPSWLSYLFGVSLYPIEAPNHFASELRQRLSLLRKAIQQKREGDQFDQIIYVPIKVSQFDQYVFVRLEVNDFGYLNNIQCDMGQGDRRLAFAAKQFVAIAVRQVFEEWVPFQVSEFKVDLNAMQPTFETAGPYELNEQELCGYQAPTPPKILPAKTHIPHKDVVPKFLAKLFEPRNTFHTLFSGAFDNISSALNAMDSRRVEMEAALGSKGTIKQFQQTFHANNRSMSLTKKFFVYGGTILGLLTGLFVCYLLWPTVTVHGQIVFSFNALEFMCIALITQFFACIAIGAFIGKLIYDFGNAIYNRVCYGLPHEGVDVVLTDEQREALNQQLDSTYQNNVFDKWITETDILQWPNYNKKMEEFAQLKAGILANSKFWDQIIDDINRRFKPFYGFFNCLPRPSKLAQIRYYRQLRDCLKEPDVISLGRAYKAHERAMQSEINRRNQLFKSGKAKILGRRRKEMEEVHTSLSAYFGQHLGVDDPSQYTQKAYAQKIPLFVEHLRGKASELGSSLDKDTKYLLNLIDDRSALFDFYCQCWMERCDLDRLRAEVRALREDFGLLLDLDALLFDPSLKSSAVGNAFATANNQHRIEALEKENTALRARVSVLEGYHQHGFMGTHSLGSNVAASVAAGASMNDASEGKEKNVAPRSQFTAEP